jgi:ABC-2 type transport system permease protein
VSPAQQLTIEHIAIERVDSSGLAVQAFVGMGVQFMLFAAMEGAIGLLVERRRGAWDRFRAAPISKAAILLAQASTSATVALGSLASVLGFGAAAFGLRLVGGFGGLFVVSIAAAAAAASIGLLIAAVGREPRASRAIGATALVFLVVLGGAWASADASPAWLRAVAPFVPTRWAVDGLNLALRDGGSFVESAALAARLAGFAVVAGGLAIILFPWNRD